MANKYGKIDFGQGANTNTGDTIYDAFDKVNKAFDEIENDIAGGAGAGGEYVEIEDFEDFKIFNTAQINSNYTELDGRLTITNNTLFDNYTSLNTQIGIIGGRLNNVESNFNSYYTKVQLYTKSEIDALIANAGGGDSVLAKTSNSIYFSGRDESKFNTIGSNAIDLSFYNVVNSTGAKIGASGENSITIGANSSTVGMFSTAIGYNSQSAGSYSTSVGYVSKTGASAFGSASFGYNTTAIGYTSYAFGNRTTTNARESVGIGTNLIANNYGSIVIGRYNESPATIETDYTVGSPLFIIGNGTWTSARSNAYVLNNDATSTQFGVANYGGDYSTNFSPNSLVSKKYVDDSIANAGGGIDLSNYYTKSEIDQNKLSNDLSNLSSDLTDEQKADIRTKLGIVGSSFEDADGYNLKLID